jgi:polyferredoxin
VTHHSPAIHPAAMVLAVVFLLSSLLLKKTFCSWLCPVGTISLEAWPQAV